MDIFERDFFADKIISEEDLKKEILWFFKSEYPIMEIFGPINDHNALKKNEKITIKIFLYYWLNIHKIPLNNEQIHRVSIYELCQIYMCIDKNLGLLIKDISKSVSMDGYKIIKIFSDKLDANIRNKIIHFFKNKNISLEWKASDKFKTEILKINFNNCIINNIKNEEINNYFSKYLQIRKDTSKNVLFDKMAILSALKNNMDYIFGPEHKNINDKIQDNSFISINKDFFLYAQAIASHKGKKDIQDKYKKANDHFDSLNEKEKNKTLNSLIETFFYIYIINDMY